MIEVTMMPVVNLAEICEEMNLHMDEFEFCRGCENDSYLYFECGDEYSEALSSELSYLETRNGGYRFERLRNDYYMMQLLRSQGLLSTVLIYVSW